MNSVAIAEACRLCGSPTSPLFTAQVLGKYEVAYARCEDCGSAQTERPHWLGECYTEDVHPDDRLYLTRNLGSYARVAFLARLLGLPKTAPIIDFGGGLGVLSRLLSEAGHAAYSDDAFTVSPFTVAAPKDVTPIMVTAIEVLEHLPAPATDLDAVFRRGADYVFVSTERYQGQGRDWWYFGPQHGQHVFFYSDRAMRQIAERFGYHLTLLNGYEALFSKRPLPGWKAAICRLAFCGPMSRPLRAWATWMHPTA